MPRCSFHFCHQAAQFSCLSFHTYPQSDSVSGSSSAGVDNAHQDQAVFDQPINSEGLDGDALQEYGPTNEL